MSDLPKPAFIDTDGTPWWGFAFSYDWEGASYGFEIVARSEAEAKARLKRLPLARFDGQIDGNPIPATKAKHIIVPLSVWWRNFRLKYHKDGGGA